MLYEVLKRFRKYFLFFCDFFVWNISFYFSFAVNHNCFSLIDHEADFFKSLIVLNISFTFIFVLFKLYDKIWRYADIEDFFYVGLASLAAIFRYPFGSKNFPFTVCVVNFYNVYDTLYIQDRKNA